MTSFPGFTQTVVPESHYMADGTVKEFDATLTVLEKIARIIHPKAFEGDHPADEGYREYAMQKARRVMALMNEIMAVSPAYKQWVERGCPK